MIDVDTFLKNHLTQIGAPLRESTMFGPAGRSRLRRAGERIILAPDGVTRLRVTQYVDGGTAVEYGNDHRSAVARPFPHVVKLVSQ